MGAQGEGAGAGRGVGQEGPAVAPLPGVLHARRHRVGARPGSPTASASRSRPQHAGATPPARTGRALSPLMHTACPQKRTVHASVGLRAPRAAQLPNSAPSPPHLICHLCRWGPSLSMSTATPSLEWCSPTAPSGPPSSGSSPSRACPPRVRGARPLGRLMCSRRLNVQAPRHIDPLRLASMALLEVPGMPANACAHRTRTLTPGCPPLQASCSSRACRRPTRRQRCRTASTDTSSRRSLSEGVGYTRCLPNAAAGRGPLISLCRAARRARPRPEPSPGAAREFFGRVLGEYGESGLQLSGGRVPCLFHHPVQRNYKLPLCHS